MLTKQAELRSNLARIAYSSSDNLILKLQCWGIEFPFIAMLFTTSEADTCQILNFKD
jgi:hypothetical protein